MSYEASRVTLQWWADPIEPLVAWAVCSTVDQSYTLYWGDGASTPMAPYSRPVRHRYSKPDLYLLTATITPRATAQVVVRESHADTVFTLDSEEYKVTAALPAMSEPVLYQIDWGDGAVTRHDATDLSPSHTYQPGFGAPEISVTDLPARWTIRYIGPKIPSIPAVPHTTFRPGHGGTGSIDLAGFPPGVVVKTLYSTSNTKTGHGSAPPVTIRPDGTATVDVAVVTDAGQDWWRWARFTWTDPGSGEPRQHTQHLRIREWTTDYFGNSAGYQNDFPLTFDWETDQPYVITVTAAPVPPGNYDISWGDGHVTPYIVGAEQRLVATRNYGANRRTWIHVTGPSGSARRCVRPLPVTSITDTYQDGVVLRWPTESIDAEGADPYRPVRIDPGDGRWPIISTLAPSHDATQRCGIGWKYRHNGHYVARISAPMTDAFDHPYTQNGEYYIESDEYDIPPDARLSWTYSADNYHKLNPSGHFTLTNHSQWWDIDRLSWSVEFSVKPGMKIEDVYECNYTELGNNRWRIDAGDTIRASSSIVVRVRYQSPGRPDFYPLDVRTVPPSFPLW